MAAGAMEEQKYGKEIKIQVSKSGLTPYYLLYGREPRLPVDYLLGISNDNEYTPVDDWLKLHKERLKYAWSVAGRNTEKSAEKRREIQDRKSTPCSIDVGTKVLIKNHVQGRNKIQDVWKPDPYVITDRLQENMYQVKSADSNETKILHRNELLNTKEKLLDDHKDICEDSDSDDEIKKFEVTEIEDVESDLCDSEEKYDTDSESPKQVSNSISDNISGKKQSKSDISNFPEETTAGKNQPDSEVSLKSKQENCLRRSKRSTAGKHSNPYNLPKSVLSSSVSVNAHSSNSEFQDFGNAVAALGASLSASLSQSFSEYLQMKNKTNTDSCL